jgi:hypothetical protein
MGKTARKWLIKNSSSSFSSIKEIVDLLLENRDLHTIHNDPHHRLKKLPIANSCHPSHLLPQKN